MPPELSLLELTKAFNSADNDNASSYLGLDGTPFLGSGYKGIKYHPELLDEAFTKS